MNGFSVADLKSAQRAWLQNAPYAALRFISVSGTVSRAQLTSFLNLLGLDDVALRNNVVADILDALLKSGQCQEQRPRLFSALPPYAVQLSEEAWLVLGDASADRAFAQSTAAYEIRSAMQEGKVTLERLLIASPAEATEIFRTSGVRTFSRSDLLDLVPRVRELEIPKAWTGFEPGPYAEWETFDPSLAAWRPRAFLSLGPGLCRGVAIGAEGNRLATTYFFRHPEGWSPLTSEDADAWALRLRHECGNPATARYDGHAVLKIDARIPYPAYVALGYLGTQLKAGGSEVEVAGIVPDMAGAIIERLALASV